MGSKIAHGEQYINVNYYTASDCANKTDDEEDHQTTKSRTADFGPQTFGAQTRTTIKASIGAERGLSQDAFSDQLQVALLISVAVVIVMSVACIGVNCMVSQLNTSRSIMPMEESQN